MIKTNILKNCWTRRKNGYFRVRQNLFKIRSEKNIGSEERSAEIAENSARSLADNEMPQFVARVA